MKRELRESNAAKVTPPDMLALALALEAARLKIAQHIAAKAPPAVSQKVEAIPGTLGAQRVDNSPYRESRQ